VRRRAAETIVKARRLGMNGLEVAIGDLARLANNDKEHPMVRFSALRALVALDAKSKAETVLRVAVVLGSDAESDSFQALARWQHEPAQQLWRQRLNDPTTATQALLISINGLAISQDKSQSAQLSKLVVDRYTAFPLRLAAARALAELQPDSLEPLVSELISGNNASQRRQRILASVLLRHHSGEAAEELLEKFALDAEPAVADAALTRLIEIAPARIAKHQSELLASRDANVRRFTVQALALFPNDEHTIALARTTNDPNPGIRLLARNTLLNYATEHNLRDAVLREADKLLGEDDWRGIEQACRLVGSLDHKPAAPQLIKILPNKRTEAHATAAWALRHLAIPETLPDIFAFTKVTADRALATFRSNPNRDFDPLFTQVFQFFAAMDYKPADSLLRRFIPKLALSPDSRCAAIYALGYLNKDNPPEDLVDALIERLSDVGVSLPEQEPVRQACAVALGRMHATKALPALRHFYKIEGLGSMPGYGCGWAIEQMTGEPVDRPVPAIEFAQDWFLTPLSSKQ